MDLLASKEFTCSVSSVLQKNVKEHGKQFMYDQKDDTAWSSDQGVPQYITITFNEPQSVSSFKIQFQGGFAGKEAECILENEYGEYINEEPFWPEDINTEQHFTLSRPERNGKVKRIKLIFNSSTDFFGRLIIYKLKIFE